MNRRFVIRVRLLRPGVRERRQDVPEHLPPEGREQESRARGESAGGLHPEGLVPVRRAGSVQNITHTYFIECRAVLSVCLSAGEMQRAG